MSKYRTNLSKYPTGALSHLDWSWRQQNGSVSASIPSTGTLRLASTSAGTKVLAYNPVRDIDDIEVLVKFRMSNDVGKQGIASLRYGGTTEANTTGYTISGSFINNAGQLAIDEGGTGYVVWAPWNYLPNITYWVRFRVNGSTVQGKVWTDGQAEPGAWTISATNTARPTGDYSGLHTYNVANMDYSYLSWGTYGDSAPGPDDAYYGTARVITPNDITWNPTNNYQEGRTSAITHIALHWWDYPYVQPSLSGVANWFKTPSSAVSAHFVVSGNTIYNMVDIKDTAWHVQGNNAYSIGIETDPNVPTGTYETVAGLIRYLKLATGTDLTILGHGEFPGASTLCPGALDRYIFQDMAAAPIPGGQQTLPPVANFTVPQTNVVAKSPLQFTDTSTNNPTSWYWNFGVGETTENHEFVSSFGPYTTDGDVNWYLSNGAVKSGNISDGQVSNLKRTVTLPNGGFVRFRYRTDSEGSFDYLRLFIDDKKQGAWSGTSPLQTSADYYIPPGTHELRWTFNKDAADSAGNDEAVIVDITITTSGSSSSTSQNPSYVYQEEGTYRVTQIATNANGSDSEVRSSYISVSPAPASASRAVKAYAGGQFSQKPVLVWNGTDWIARPVKTWNGTEWL